MNLQKKDERVLKVLVVLVVVLFIAVLVLAWYALDISRQKQGEGGADNVASADIEQIIKDLDLSNDDPAVAGVVAAVAKHMLLPKGNFTISTVEKADVLRQQNPFLFKYVRNGDKLLSYVGGMIAYDPVLDKIVDAVRLPAGALQ